MCKEYTDPSLFYGSGTNEGYIVEAAKPKYTCRTTSNWKSEGSSVIRMRVTKALQRK